MWAQTWENIYDLVKPFPDVEETSLTEVLVEKNYTPIKMFEVLKKTKNNFNFSQVFTIFSEF